ncbi:MAG: thioredoxin family protein [Candidatus Spechtbacteria bacterium]|nr:thioredoxin family protein [Candidatus Spechtbacteria bacterium]
MIKVTLIRPSGCQHCVQVKGTLEKLKTDYPDLVLEEIEATTPEGQALITKHGILSSPGILINDEFFAMGGATEKQLREKFDEIKQK